MLGVFGCVSIADIFLYVNGIVWIILLVFEFQKAKKKSMIDDWIDWLNTLVLYNSRINIGIFEKYNLFCHLLLYMFIFNMPLVKSATTILIRQRMLWVLKRTVSMRRLLLAFKTYVKTDGQTIVAILRTIILYI